MFIPQRSNPHTWYLYHAAANGLPLSLLLERNQRRELEQRVEIERARRLQPSGFATARQRVARESRSRLELLWSALRTGLTRIAGHR
jgi:hypothetical protein